MTKIENEEQYKALMQRIETLLPLVNDSTPTSDPNYVEFEMLGNLTGITTEKLASFLGLSTSKTEDYITGKTEPTLAFGKVISQKLNIAPERVLGLA